MKTFVSIVLLALFSHYAGAHSGGTDSKGCHTNHKTGNYHCHDRKTPAGVEALAIYCHIGDDERGCGYTYCGCKNLVSKYGGYCVYDRQLSAAAKESFNQ